MLGTRSGWGRIVAMGIGLAIALLLVLAGEAHAGKYSVAQCGWHLDADADWADSTGGAKFRPDAYCATPAGADPFDGAHLKSFTRDGQSAVSGTRFARWRWTAPPGAAITRVSGTWWHALHDGLQQRIGVGNWSGGFDPFAVAGTTDVTPRQFVAGFSAGMPAVEDRLLCAKPETDWCSLDPGSWSALRALTLTLEENAVPAAGVGGELLDGGWRKGVQVVQVWGGDTGAGIRFGETFLDGARVALTEYPCAKALVDGEWRATRMRPCELGVSAAQTVTTNNFSDGPHSVAHCVVDFAWNQGCTPQHTIYIDNNPPAHPRSAAVVGGSDWRRVDSFDVAWEDPDQGAASPISGAFWRLMGAGGYDTGVQFAPGVNLTALRNLHLVRPGAYSLMLWLRDGAGNDAPTSAVFIGLRLDDVAPSVAFAPSPDTGFPDTVRAEVADEHSGPAGGVVFYRRLDSASWSELPTKFQVGDAPGLGRLVAQVPDSLPPGTYVFRADAADGAGNVRTSTRRIDGAEMAIRKVPPVPAVKEAVVVKPKLKTRIFARLRWGRHKGTSVTVPFGTSALLSGRLLDANGAGLSGRALRVVSRPSRGALAPARTDEVTTGPHGGFRFELAPGPSRRITVAFGGAEELDQATRRPLLLRVRGGLDFHVKPASLRTGQALRMGGRVRTQGAPLPRRGKLVAIQYRESATGRWRPVLVTRTDHSGRFHARYRFRYVSGSATIRLRALALPEERWPYAPGASPPVTVHVHG